MAEEVEGHDELERTILRAAKQLGYSSIKELQLEVIKKIIIGHDVFAVLPTGFILSSQVSPYLSLFRQIQSTTYANNRIHHRVFRHFLCVCACVQIFN